MPDNDILTIEEIEDLGKRLQDFLGRLKPTIALANRNRQIIETLGALNLLVAEPPPPKVASAKPKVASSAKPKVESSAKPKVESSARPKVASSAKPAKPKAASAKPKAASARPKVAEPVVAPEPKAAETAPAAPATAQVTKPARAEAMAEGPATDESVLEFIRRAAGGATPRELVEAFGANRDQIKYRLKRLRSEGLVSASGDRTERRYHATSAPVEVAPKRPSAKGTKQAAPTQPTPRAATKAKKPEKAKAATTTKGPKLDSVERSIVDLLGKAGTVGLGGGDLKDGVKTSRGRLRKALQRLRGDGHVRMTGSRNKSRYFIGA